MKIIYKDGRYLKERVRYADPDRLQKLCDFRDSMQAVSDRLLPYTAKGRKLRKLAQMQAGLDDLSARLKRRQAVCAGKNWERVRQYLDS